MAMLDEKELTAKMLGWMRNNTSSVIGVNFAQSLGASASGTKTASATIDIPEGYEIVPNTRPLSVFVSGNANSWVTERSIVTQSGNMVSFTYWLHNPNKSSLTLYATILCRRTIEFPLNPPEYQTYYAASWTATSSNAVGVRVTDYLDLPAGVYVLMGKAPVISGGSSPGFHIRSVESGEFDKTTINLIGSQQGFTTLLKLDTNQRLYLASSGSPSVTYSYLERGGFKAVRVA